jgi:hypothetical protein
VIGDIADIHSLPLRKMADALKDCVLNSAQTDVGGIAVADRLVQREKREKTVDQFPKYLIRAVDQQLRPPDGERQFMLLPMMRRYRAGSLRLSPIGTAFSLFHPLRESLALNITK